ncbi:MAG: tryptophan 7-halogenase [Chthoniobacteraceae bacterium]
MPSPQIDRVITLGGGSAGCIAALTLKRRLPRLEVIIVRSPEIGVIGVGEGTTPNITHHFHNFLGLSRGTFFAEAQPTWKLGLRFEWGPRPYFHYALAGGYASHWKDLPKTNGFYTRNGDEMSYVTLESRFMEHDRVFDRMANGLPNVRGDVPYHLENRKLVVYLEARCLEAGVQFMDRSVVEVRRGESGIAALILDDGQSLRADLFLDASGFRSELIGRALAEPFESYEDTLFCDRALIGGWERTDETVRPYTTAETMNAGWCWRIDHEHFINRGYVFSSQFLSDDEAERELRAKNPRLGSVRAVSFRCGVHRRTWIDNVVAVGNAAGFVEPLEATALMVICGQMQALTIALEEADARPTESLRRNFNRFMSGIWNEIRDFLAVHYRFNTRLETPFWRHCRSDTPLREAEEIVNFYRENGPSHSAQSVLLRASTPFGLNGFLVILQGQAVPTDYTYAPSASEWEAWQRHCRDLEARAQRAFTVPEALAVVRDPRWQWTG